MKMRKYTRAELRHIRECRYCREKLSRRKAAGLGAAVATFHESERRQGRADEAVEKRMRLCTGEGCGEGYSAEDSEKWSRCPKCGSKLSEPSFDFVLPERTDEDSEDEDERRTDEDEGRVRGQDDSNDYRGSGDRMSRPGHEPSDTGSRDNPKKGKLAEALKTYRESYKNGKAGSKA